MSDESHSKLSSMSKQKKITMTIIIDTLIDIQVKHDFLDPEWKEKLSEFLLKDYLMKHDQDFAKRVELKKMEAVNKARNFALTEYSRTLKGEEKQRFLSDLLGGNMEDGNILERFGSYESFLVDGKRKLASKDQDGKPKLGIPPSELIQCKVGWHVKGGYCSCTIWNSCEIRKEERMKYLAKTDPNMTRDSTRRFANW